MADAIVQTIKIEVDGADQAATEIKKVGQATEDVQATAAKTAGGTQELGKGLDQVSQKSGVSSRELRSLGKIMSAFGAGELAGTAVGFARIAMVLGPLGVAAFAVAEAFSFVRSTMKAADDQAKAVAGTFANIAKVSAEMQPGAAAAKAVENNVDLVANSLRTLSSIRTAINVMFKDTISPLTTSDTLAKAFVKNIEAMGISINDAKADAGQLGTAFQRVGLEAAKLMERMSPIEKANFAKALKSLGFTDEQIANFEKGPAAFEKITASANRQKAATDQLSASWDKLNQRFLASSFTPPPVEDWSNLARVINSIATMTVDGAWQWIKDSFNAAVGWVGTKIAETKAAIIAWVNTPIPGAWQWIKDTAVGAWDSVKALGQQAYNAVVAFVTTAPANAWQWIKDTFQSVMDSIKQSLGIGAAAGGGAAGGQVGGSAGFAGGGLLGGRGTGTSDSNLAWVSRGEHIMPARAVSQPGVLAFLEALRFSGGNLRAVLNGMGHFALGGMVAPRLSIPAFAGGGMSNVTIAFPGLPEITGLRATSRVVDELRNAAAMAQVRSGGRKPSRYS